MAEARRVDLDNDAVLEHHALTRHAFDLALEHRHRVQQAQAVAHTHPRLATIGGNDHHCADLARAEVRAPVAERSKKDRDGCEGKTLAASPTTTQPSLS